VLHAGIAWTHLPQELRVGSGVTCRRRLDEWQRAGVWERLHAELLARLRSLTGSNRNDAQRSIEAVPAVAGLPGRPRRRPASLVGDRGYDNNKYRRLLREHGIRPMIARRQASMAPGSAASAGSSNAPSRGCTT
jgi:hypothetical protein